MNFSPAPWKVRKSGTGRTAIVASDNLEVAFVFRNAQNGDGNAALIAAAPHLLQALEALLPRIEEPKMSEIAEDAIARSRHLVYAD